MLLIGFSIALNAKSKGKLNAISFESDSFYWKSDNFMAWGAIQKRSHETVYKTDTNTETKWFIDKTFGISKWEERYIYKEPILLSQYLKNR